MVKHSTTRWSLHQTLICLILVILVAAGLLFHRYGQKSIKVVSDYDSCVAEGNAVMEIYPSICVTKDGRQFVNPHEKVE